MVKPRKPRKPRSYGVQVIADSSGEWVGNQYRMATREKAQEYGRDLAARWTAVREWRVVVRTANAMWTLAPVIVTGD